MSVQLIAEKAYKLQVRSSTPPVYDTKGRLVEKEQRSVSVEFVRGGAPAWAREVGLREFTFGQMPERGVTREAWICWFDSDDAQLRNGWDDEELEVIDERLREAVGTGKIDAIIVEKPRRRAPWPTYDKVTVQGQLTADRVGQKIAQKVTEDGYDPAEVAAYERDNLNRPEVLAALAELSAREPEEELIEA